MKKKSQVFSNKFRTNESHGKLLNQLNEMVMNSSIKKEMPIFSECKELEKFDSQLPLVEVNNRLDKVDHQIKFLLDRFLDRVGWRIIISISDKETWKDCILCDNGTTLSENKSTCCYNALKEVYRNNYEIVVDTYKEKEHESNPSIQTNKFTDDTLKYLEYICKNPISHPIYPFVTGHIIIIYYQIFHLPKFLKTFQSQPKLNDEETRAYNIFIMSIYIVRINLTFKSQIEMLFVDGNWYFFINCLMNILETLLPVLQKSILIAKMAEEILDVIGVYYSTCRLDICRDVKIVHHIFHDKKSTKTMRILSAKVLCHVELCEMSMEYLVDWLHENINVECIFQERFPVQFKREISNIVDYCYTMVLMRKSCELVHKNLLTNFDYKMLRKFDPVNHGVKIYENVVKIFNHDYKQSIMLKIKDNVDLSKGDRIAVNCLFVVIKKIGCSKNAAENIVNKMIIFNVDSLLEYLKELYDYITLNIAAMRISEAILYGMCNMFGVFQKPMENSWILILKKYFHHPNCSLEIKLAAAVKLSTLLHNLDIDTTGEIVFFLMDVTRSMRGLINGNSNFMGFYVPEVNQALSIAITFWITKFKSDELQTEETTKKFLFYLQKIILKIHDDDDDLQIVDSEYILNEIMNLFNIRFKHEIISKWKTNSDLDDQEELSLNCLHLSTGIIRNFKKNNPLYPILFNDVLCQTIFSDLVKFSNTNVLVQEICESILYTFCFFVHPSYDSIEPSFWIRKLEECLLKDNLSLEMRFTSSIVLGRMSKYFTEFDFDLLSYLLNVLRMANNDDNRRYMDLPCEGIQLTVTSMIQILRNKIGYYFMADNNSKWGLEKIQSLLCNILENQPIEETVYRTNLNSLVIFIIKSFSLEWKKTILNKIENNSMLNEKERIAVNCFCNAFNVLGQHIIDDAQNDMICDPCELILGYINDLSGFINNHGIAARISEVLLYCLSNVYKLETISNRNKWSPILWTLFTNLKASKEIRMGSGVTLALVLKTEDKSKHQVEIEELKLYFEEIINSLQETYLGFTRSEIFVAFGKVNIYENC